MDLETFRSFALLEIIRSKQWTFSGKIIWRITVITGKIILHRSSGVVIAPRIAGVLAYASAPAM